MIAIRGATRVEHNDRQAILGATQELLEKIRQENDLVEDEVVSAFFTMTPDLDATFPAAAARRMGWTDTAMLGAQETSVPGSLDGVIRVLIHAQISGPGQHVYLRGTEVLRLGNEFGEDASATSTPQTPRIGSLLIVGLGLMGGSVARALRGTELFDPVLGHDLQDETRQRAARDGFISQGGGSLEEKLQRADVILLALPVVATLGWLDRWGQKLQPGTVVLDVGSTQNDVCQKLGELPQSIEAVGGHPITGDTETGFNAARDDLFEEAQWAWSETSRTGTRARKVARALSRAVGATPFWIEPAQHDQACAATSHLPYLMALALKHHLQKHGPEGPTEKLWGPGAQDMTRLAHSSPQMTAAILAANWPAIRQEARNLLAEMEAMVQDLDRAWDRTPAEFPHKRAEMFQKILEDLLY